MIRSTLARTLLAALALTVAVPAVASAAEPDKNIVEKAVAVNANLPIFDTLITAATCGDGAIANALATADDITLFAPTDWAFVKLGRELGLGKAGLNPGNVCTLPKAVLEDVLKYHVYAEGAVRYGQAVRLAPITLTMLNEDDARLRGTFWNLRIDGARIILPNVRASNGIIHVVAEVMTPPGF